MISDGAVFEDDHLPDPIVGRNRHINEMIDAFAPIEDGQRAENCFLFGPPLRTGPRVSSPQFGQTTFVVEIHAAVPPR
ncbi:hypothetical protein J2744_001623 [Halorubrum trapanicum]|uniref:Uncharacterized protein n=1 Tax=Halorubrum trapanicum TaxID=29284 RepID=A0A8J7RVU4_9EURY|nr:hypothetical protein [Halorubrum trapanicum]MBP1901945.1 hypothetical protein [Halorubrum trapanicum]